MSTFQSFNDLDIPVPLARSLELMKFLTPTPVQAAAIPVALNGNDVLATAQTGTGKTAAFGIPLLCALAKGPRQQALILAPSRELAAQIFSVLRQMSNGLQCRGVLVVGGESFYHQSNELRRGVHYIVATPGRLNDHLNERTVGLQGISMVVLDEVDRMLDMGFAPQIASIMRQVPKTRQTLLFSATLPQEITRLAASLLRDPVRIAVDPIHQSAPKVTAQTIHTTNEAKNGVLLKEMREREGRILVFTRTKSRTERIAKLLYNEGHDVVALHGGRSQGQRKQALERFKNGSRRIMVATDLAGRGIDVPDIEHVVNYDLPATREDYIHRIGRTGRYGREGKALNLVVTTDLDAPQILTGVKAKSRVVFRSHRRRR